MRTRLRFVSAALGVLAAAFLVFALTGVGRWPAQAQAKTFGGGLDFRMMAREKVISGAYKVYGLKDQPICLWLAKTVLKNNTGGMIHDLKIRYRLGEYADWCSWQTWPAMVPGQTVVDLYNPILNNRCAQLTSRAPAELEMECEYTDASGQRRTLQKNERLTLLSRRELYFTDLTSQERTGSSQDLATYAPLLGAWVTYTDGPVAGLAGLANKRAKGAGSQTSDENCLAVMRELYEAMRTIRITYQSPAYQVDSDKTFDPMLVQTLQYPRDTIEKRSGTCVDLAILYAAMMQAVGIKPFLVVLDDHVFPVGRTPGGQMVPVEATGVGGGGRNSIDFAQAVQSATKTFQGVQQTGRFVLVDCQEAWSAGISPPELEALPADILDRWKITELMMGAAEPAATADCATPPATGGGQAPANVLPTSGTWSLTVTHPGGAAVQGTVQLQVKGTAVQLVAEVAYTAPGPDGAQHQAQEKTIFAGSVDAGRIVARCTQAFWTLDGQAVTPTGLPYTLTLTLGPDGKSAQGTVANAGGQSAQVAMQAQ